jgi:hypothetical protein
MTRPPGTAGSCCLRGWLGRLALLAGSLLLCAGLVLLAELGARWHDPGYLVRVRGLHVFSDLYGWTLRPSASTVVEGVHVSVNAEGYRGAILPAGRGDRSRVVVLGDSLAFGHDVADGVPFASQLDARQNGLRVANLAVPGYGTTQEWLKLTREGLALQPDVVILCFCRANDFVDTISPVFLYDGLTPKPYCTLDGGRLELHPARISTRQRFLLRLGDESHLVNRLLMLRGPVSALGLARGARQAGSWEERYRRLLGDGDHATRATLAVIHQMAEATTRQRAAFVLAVFPDRRAFRRSAERRMGAFQGAFAAGGLVLVDMADGFQQRGLVFDDVASDTIGHLNPRGHAVAAEILESELLALKRQGRE